MSTQKGFTGILILLVGILVTITLGIYIFSISKSSPIKEIEDVVTPVETINTYTNDKLSFSIKYDKNLKVQEDSEEEFNKRGNGEFRKNFTNYVGYSPEKFAGAVMVLDETGNYEKNPLTIWVFDNPDNLSIDSWFTKYWYYPFVWGDFTARSNGIVPTKDATIGGQLAKYSVVDYQSGKPKFVYISKDKKMYLFRIIGESGDKILATFKFL